MRLGDAKHVHCIGIGGMGLSAIAAMLVSRGAKVSGSNNTAAEMTDGLKEIGVEIFIDHDANNLDQDVDLMIYSTAVPKDNPEFVEAQKRELTILTYPEALGEFSETMKTVAVSGTHGKTTTTAMTAGVLIDGGIDPTVIVGSLLAESGSNYIEGKSEYLVAEACEYRRNFLTLKPHILVITNIEEDHLDYFKDLADIQDAFKELVDKIDENGAIVCDPIDPKVVPVLKDAKCKVIDYTKVSAEMELEVPGNHNIQNAKAAYAVGQILEVEEGKALKALKDFKGTWRRFEFKGKTKGGAALYDDYAHHPTAVMAVLRGVREKYGLTGDDKKVIAVFQPHLFSRTKILLDDFAESFSDADEAIIVPIYHAREEDDDSINSEMLVEAINKKSNNAVFKTKKEAAQYLKEKGSESVILTIGAGDIYQIANELLK